MAKFQFTTQYTNRFGLTREDVRVVDAANEVEARRGVRRVSGADVHKL